MISTRKIYCTITDRNRLWGLNICCQGSGYISDNTLTTADIYDLMDELSQQLPWIGDCVHKIDVTNIGRQHDLTDLLKPLEDISVDDSMLLEAKSEQ